MMIRAATAADADQISQVLIRSIVALCTTDHLDDPKHIAHWTDGKSPDDVRGWLASGTQVLVSVAADKIMAVGAYTPEGQILLLYVAPKAQGQGHSTTLLAAMEAELAKLGVQAARLVSSKTAEAFYQRRGWQIDGARVACYSTDGQPMIKPLNSAKSS